MSTCSDFREMLLEAEPSELRAEGGGALAEHLRRCDGCRRAALVILAANDDLAEALAGEADPAAVDAVLRDAGVASVAGEAPPRPGPWRRARNWAWAGGALAAAVAGVILIRGRPAPTPPSLVSARVAAQERLPVVADASADRVAVLATDDPDITVLWFFQEE
jgi:hypothetical protein